MHTSVQACSPGNMYLVSNFSICSPLIIKWGETSEQPQLALFLSTFGKISFQKFPNPWENR